MQLFATARETPIGNVIALRNERGLVSLGFADGMPGEVLAVADDRRTVGDALDRYFDGAPEALADLDLDPAGTPLQLRIWRLLRRIPPGETRSYGELGAEVGTSGRVVGNAMAANPICLALPCHRVIRADGSWNGYAYGNHRKRWLLAHEAK